MSKNPAAVALGRKGGKATAKNRTAEQRSAAARKAVEARWRKELANLEDRITTRKPRVQQKKAANLE